MKKLVLALALLAGAVSAQAADFVDTSKPKDIINFGLRFGITSSSLSADLPGTATDYAFSWRRGFATGAVVDVNIRDFFSIRPAIYFENRSYDYTMVDNEPDSRALSVSLGHTRRNALSVPVLASFHFNISNAVRWDVETGPYFTFGLGSGKDHVNAVSVSAPEGTQGSYTNISAHRDYYGDQAWQHRSFDLGWQIGTGIEVLRHYVFNISYQHSLRNATDHDNIGYSMKNKGWPFAVGYVF